MDKIKRYNICDIENMSGLLKDEETINLLYTTIIPDIHIVNTSSDLFVGTITKMCGRVYITTYDPHDGTQDIRTLAYMMRYRHHDIMHSTIFIKEDISDKHLLYIEMSDMYRFIDNYTEKGVEGFDY